MLIIAPYIHSRSLYIFPSYFQTFKWETAPVAAWAEAAGDTPEGTRLKLVLTTKARLGSVGERRWLLFESLHSVWRCGLHSCEACYPQKKKKLSQMGHVPLFKPTYTSFCLKGLCSPSSVI